MEKNNPNRARSNAAATVRQAGYTLPLFFILFFKKALSSFKRKFQRKGREGGGGSGPDGADF